MLIYPHNNDERSFFDDGLNGVFPIAGSGAFGWFVAQSLKKTAADWPKNGSVLDGVPVSTCPANRSSKRS